MNIELNSIQLMELRQRSIYFNVLDCVRTYRL
jgi:hypothetical protein